MTRICRPLGVLLALGALLTACSPSAPQTPVASSSSPTSTTTSAALPSATDSASPTPTVVTPPKTLPGEAGRVTWTATKMVLGSVGAIKAGSWAVVVNCAPTTSGGDASASFTLTRNGETVLGGSAPCTGDPMMYATPLPSSRAGALDVTVDRDGESTGYLVFAPESAAANA